MNSIIIAIITVVKEDLYGLQKTRFSIESQSYSSYIHIIVHGGGDSETLLYLKSLSTKNTLFVSEPDSGIYNAMNKGWELAPPGSFLYFLNAGDIFAEKNSLEVASETLRRNRDALWGCTTHEEVEVSGDNWVCKLVSPPSVSNQLHAFGYRSHQAVIMRKDLLSHLHGFDESLQIAADWDLIVRALIEFTPCIWKTPLGKFELGGESTIRIQQAHKELKLLRRRYLKLNFYSLILENLWEAIYLRDFGFRNFFSFLFRRKQKKLSGTSSIKPRGNFKDFLISHTPYSELILRTYRIANRRMKYRFLIYLFRKLRILPYDPNHV
jgi:hypothetical protein